MHDFERSLPSLLLFRMSIRAQICPFDVVGYLHYLEFVALYYAQKGFCYSGADAVYPQFYITFQFLVYEKTYTFIFSYLRSRLHPIPTWFT